MKLLKQLFVFFFVFVVPFFSIFPQQNSSVSVVDSILVNDDHIYKYAYDSLGNIKSRLTISFNATLEKWIDARRETKKYDSNNNILEKLIEFWERSNSLWLNSCRHTYQYDSLGNEILHIRQGARAQIWENQLKETKTYNSDGNIIVYLTEHSVWPFHGWRKESQIIYEYNLKGYLTSKHTEYWNDGWFTQGAKYNYFYDEQGNIQTALYEIISDGYSAPVELHTYTYDNTNQLISEFIKKAPERRTCPTCPIYYLPLENFEKYSFSYDQYNNLILQLREVWEDSVWTANYKESFVYNSNNKITFYLTQKLNDSNWEGVVHYTYKYDSNGNMIHFIGKRNVENSWVLSGGLIKFYDSFGNLLKFTASEIKVYYSTATNVHNSKLNTPFYSLSQNYPNPFNPSTTITYQIPLNVKGETANVNLKVYDVLGREVATLVNKEQSAGNYEVQFNASNLGSGIYFYQFKSGRFIETKKMVLLR